jgi:hypothetical protein
MPTPAQPMVNRASVEVFRIHDVAQEIDLVTVESLLAGRGPVARIRLSSVQPKAIAFDDPPVVTDLLAPPLEIDGESVVIRASARIYGFGVVSLSLDVQTPHPLEWPAFERFAREAERETSALGFWRESLDTLLHALAPALRLPEMRSLVEDYAIVTVRELESALTAAELTAAVDLVPVLTHDARALSDAARRDLLRFSHSYYTDDLVVLTWERAFVLEPAQDFDIADVLEVANAQLLVLRYYDTLLDSELPNTFRQSARARALAPMTGNRYARAANRMRAMVAEVTQITEKVENALKVTEDVYLARVYSSALELFRVRYWTGSIDRKLSLIRDAYTALYDEAVATRMEWMEAIIVLLIVIEVVLALVGWGGE